MKLTDVFDDGYSIFEVYPGQSSGKLKNKVHKLVGSGKMSCSKASKLKNNAHATPKDKLRATWYQNLHCHGSKQIREEEVPQEIRDKYLGDSHGHLAFVLHELTGMPMCGLYNNNELLHSFVMDPYSRTSLDIRGPMSINDIRISPDHVIKKINRDNWIKNNNPDRQEIEEAGNCVKQFLRQYVRK